jgi:hypothetical protein
MHRDLREKKGDLKEIWGDIEKSGMRNLEERQRDPWRSGEDTERFRQDTRKLKEIRGSISGEDTGRSEIRNLGAIQEDAKKEGNLCEVQGDLEDPRGHPRKK